MKKLIKYYYTSYYKFFKLWQSDADSARNAKAMIALILLLLWLSVFDRIYTNFISNDVLDIGGKYKPIGYLISLPLIFLVMGSIKDYYPNDLPKNLIRGIIVSLTIPLAFIIMYFSIA